jgi:hypothetical protein
MKYLSLILLILSFRVGAQTCAPTSKEMAQYFTQSHWKPHTIQGEGLKPVEGFIDGEGNFRFGNISRGGSIQVKVSVDPGNKEFFRYCRAGEMGFLASMRREGINSYKVTARYLPAFDAFAKSPFEVVNWRPWRNQLEFNFSSNAVADGFRDKPRSNFVKALGQQVAAQKEVGIIELDLTGFDDLVCDFVQGRIRLTYVGQGISDAPVVSQRKLVEPNDVRAAYRGLREQIKSTNSKEMNLFMAGRVISKLELERRINAWDDQKSFEVFKKLSVPDLSKLQDLDEAGVQCAADQLQSYARESENNFFNLNLLSMSLDGLEASLLVKK